MNQELITAMMEFSIRVLEGKDCTPQETAVLPHILLLLLNKQSDKGFFDSKTNSGVI